MKIRDIGLGKGKIEKSEQVKLVRNKLVMSFRLKGRAHKESVRNFIRKIIYEMDIPMRNRVDLGEDGWVDKESVEGVFLAVIRLEKELDIDKFKKEIKEKLVSDGKEEVLEFINAEIFKVGDFRNINEVYDRVVYEVVLEIPGKSVDSNIELKRGNWTEKVRLWNGEIAEGRVRGRLRIKADKLESEADVYKLNVDVPLGLDVFMVLERQFKLKKGSLVGYPVKGLVHYESLDDNKEYITRPRCEITGRAVERSMGGLGDNKSIDSLFI